MVTSVFPIIIDVRLSLLIDWGDCTLCCDNVKMKLKGGLCTFMVYDLALVLTYVMMDLLAIG